MCLSFSHFFVFLLSHFHDFLFSKNYKIFIFQKFFATHTFGNSGPVLLEYDKEEAGCRGQKWPVTAVNGEL
jgi:hypothetical protein